MNPTHKFNSGNKATLCKSCRKTIVEDFTDDLLCTDCQRTSLDLLRRIDNIINLDGDEFTDGECLDMIFQLKLDNFLKNIDDEES
jgi:hypothetical protein